MKPILYIGFIALVLSGFHAYSETSTPWEPAKTEESVEHAETGEPVESAEQANAHISYCDDSVIRIELDLEVESFINIWKDMMNRGFGWS